MPPWKEEVSSPTLREVHASIPVAKNASFFRKWLAFLGPGLMIAVGYMDPGNWATDLAGGARFGYTLLSVILISNVMAIVLQYLALKLGIATGRDLAQACRDHYSKPTVIVLWLLCEVAIIACDLAEVIGSAIALNLLFHIPLILGVVVTSLDVFIFLWLSQYRFRILEVAVAFFILIIGCSFAYEIFLAHPTLKNMFASMIPSADIVLNPSMLYIAIGIIGATVMPHNLYLHSSIVQTRAFERNDEGKAMAIRFASIDSMGALLGAFFINAAILVLSAAAFHGTGHQDVADIFDAYKLLTPVLGAGLASFFFAVALLASGQNSTVTGTLAGQIVMEGFLDLRLRPWVRRLITRLLAIVPAIIVIALHGAKGIGQLLVFSQVVLSMQLSFAVVPLLVFTGDKHKMGKFVNSMALNVSAWSIAVVIIGLNFYLLYQIFVAWIKGA